MLDEVGSLHVKRSHLVGCSNLVIIDFRAVPALTDGEELTASGTHSSKGDPQIKFPFAFQDPVSGDSNPTHLSKLKIYC
jgi:invasion protein IalB